MELIDSSAWIEYLRGTGSPAHHEVRDLLADRPADIVTTEPVVMELLSGANSPTAFAQLDRLTSGLHLLSVDNALDYRYAAVMHRAVRTRGQTVRRVVDCLIAAVAARTGATLVHRDRDFDVLADSVSDLRVRSLR